MCTSKLQCFRIATIALVCSLLWGCGSKPDGYPTWVLRGDTILEMRLPTTKEGRAEVMALDTDRIAYRAFLPINVQTIINRATVPDAMWDAFEALRHDWCAQHPTFVPDTPKEANYVVTVKCGPFTNPVYHIRPADLPAPLRALVDLVPSTIDPNYSQ